MGFKNLEKASNGVNTEVLWEVLIMYDVGRIRSMYVCSGIYMWGWKWWYGWVVV